jgi:hypothetical protein
MFELIVGIVIGMLVAWATVWFMLKTVITRVNDEMGKMLDKVAAEVEKESDSRKLIMARVELHDDTFYVYNKENNEFMAQGKTLAEVKEHMFTRFSKDKFNVIADPDENVDVLKKLKETANETSNSI